MSRTESARVERTRGRVIAPVLALVLVIGGAVLVYRAGWLNDAICDGPCGASVVTPPHGLDVPGTPVVPTVPTASDAAVSGSAVASAVTSALAAPVLGSHVGFVALDARSGAVLDRQGTGAFTPASTTKLLTMFSSLSLLDPQHRFATSVVRDGSTVTLVGGGDPFLDTKAAKNPLYAHVATLADLARKSATALKKAGTTKVTLRYDASLFSGPSASPAWPSGYVGGDVVTPVSALWVDRGAGTTAGLDLDPAATAAQHFATLLAKDGVDVSGAPTSHEAPASATPVARVLSATVAQILESTAAHSDNNAAEVMLRQVGIAGGEAGSFTGGVTVVKRELKAHGVSTAGLVLHDGSGLSRDDRISPLTLAQVLRAASARARTSSLVTDLPVAGFNGTILSRFETSAARAGLGLVHAKSGTLSGVNSLAGFTSDAEGTPIYFAVMSDAADPGAVLQVKDAIDAVVASLTTCRCSGGS